jgi:hypothetical protein
VPTYETYPVNDHSPVDHGIVVTMSMTGDPAVTLLGPYTEAVALAELEKLAQFGTVEINVTDSVVLRVSDRELVFVHQSFFSTWTARAVVARYVHGAS